MSTQNYGDAQIAYSRGIHALTDLRERQRIPEELKRISSKFLNLIPDSADDLELLAALYKNRAFVWHKLVMQLLLRMCVLEMGEGP